MSKRPPEVRQAILERLCWQVAERNDNLVAEAIYKSDLQKRGDRCHIQP